MEETKVCSKCKRELPLSEFNKNKSNKDGLQYQCKVCQRLSCEKYRNSHKEHIKQHYLDTKENVSEYQKQYREKNRDKISRQRKSYREQNKEKVSLQKKKSRERNLNTMKQYREDNREKLSKQQLKRKLERLKEDSLYHFKYNICGNIRRSFSRKGYKKTSHTFDIVGIDFDGLKKHLYKTWLDNYGTEYNGEEYHIDHIIPLATAKTEEDVIRLCHYTNLQLLKPEDNLKKRNKLDFVLEG